MKKHVWKRLVSLLLVLAIGCGFALPAAAADGKPQVSWEQVDNGEVRAALPRNEVTSPEKEPDYQDSDLVRVSIVLEKPSTLEMGYSTMGIAENRSAMSYRTALARSQELAVKAISAQALEGQPLDVVWKLTLAANLVSANVPYGKLDAIRQVPGVKDVALENRYEPAVVQTQEEAAEPLMATSGAMIGSAVAWASGYTGAGRRIAVIDTGIDTAHQSFDGDALRYSLEQNKTADISSLHLLSAEEIAGVLPKLNIYPALQEHGWTAEDCYQNEKIAFGFNYIDEDLDVTHENDNQGEHGSHVAGIASANAYIPAEDGTYSKALDAVKVQGVAPDAQLMVMKVFGRGGGAYDSDYMVAIEDAILLGADAVNLSLGSSNPGLSYHEEDVYQQILNTLTQSDTVVAMAAGNSGAWSEQATELGLPYGDDVSFDTVGSPGSYTNSMAVASADNSGSTGHYLQVAGEKIFYTESSGYSNQPMTTLAGEQSYVLVDGLGQDSEFAAVASELAGKIAVCYRGELSFSQKANNAVKYGAIGVIVCNNQPGVINMDLSDYKGTAPCVSVTQEDGQLLLQSAERKQTADGTVYYAGSMEVSKTIGTSVGDSGVVLNRISSFSSVGIPGSLKMKPEITAPGGSIYSVNGAHLENWRPAGGHDAYEHMSGTSMASPQVAGMVALAAQYLEAHDLAETTGFSPRQLAQSLLMSTAEPMNRTKDTYWSILQQGAGLANIGALVNAESFVMMDSDAGESAADGKVKVELGDDPDRTGSYTFGFTLYNLTDVDRYYTLSADLFTQALNREYLDLGEYLDLATAALAANVTWKVDGVPLKPDAKLDGCDFNGDGRLDASDGQALLEYATGVRESISGLDQADRNGDGKVTTYDAYLFLKELNSGAALLKGQDSLHVTVELSLTDEQKAALDEKYPKGAYVEGYVYAEPVSTGEGVKGVSHSIPVLGFYGNWTDPSMYDVGSFVEYRYGTETRTPYLSEQSNYLALQYAQDEGTLYSFGGNPVVEEDVYLEMRNSLNNACGDKLVGYAFNNIRNAVGARIQVTDVESGQVYLEDEQITRFYSAYYHTNGGRWMIPSYRIPMNWAGTDAQGNPLPEGTTVEVTLQVAPEFYQNADGSIDWDRLGDGATQHTQLTIDNTAPVLESIQVDPLNETLTIVARDNEYLACIALYNRNASDVIALGSPNQQEPGETCTMVLGKDDLYTGDLWLQVYDYAMNVVTYRLHIGDQLGIEEPTYDFIGYGTNTGIPFTTQYYKWVGFNKGCGEEESDYRGLAEGLPAIYSATEADGYVFALTDSELLYVIPLEDMEDKTPLVDLDDMSTVGIPSYVWVKDLCYNVQDGYLYCVTNYNHLVRIDKLTGAYTNLGELSLGTREEAAAMTCDLGGLGDEPLHAGAKEESAALTCDRQGNFYVAAGVPGNTEVTQIYTFTLDTFSAPTKVGSFPYPFRYSTVKALTWDPKDDCLYVSYCDNGDWFGTDVYREPTRCIIRLDPTQVTHGTIQSEVVGNPKHVFEAFFIPGAYDTGTGWYEITDRVMQMTISADALRMVRGSSESLSVELKPWTLSRFDVTWSSSDPGIATVDANGTVHAVSNGMATITATAVSDPEASISCQVEVYSVLGNLKGLIENSDGTSSLFTWDLNEEAAPVLGAQIQETYSAVTYDRENGVVYAQNQSENQLCKMNPETGEILSRTATTDQKIDGLAFCEFLGEGQQLVGMDKYNLWGPMDLSTGDWTANRVGDLGYWLNKMGPTCKLVAVASAGMMQKQYGPVPTQGELFLAMNSQGSIMQVFGYFNNNSGAYVCYPPSAVNTSLSKKYGMTFDDADGLNRSASMVSTADHSAVVFSYFDGKTNQLFLMPTEYAYGSLQSPDVIYLGSTGTAPMRLYDAEYYGVTSETAPAMTTEEPVNEVSGSLTAVTPQSTGTVSHKDGTGTLVVTAKDGAGNDVTPTNGLVTVQYDPALVQLETYTVQPAYQAAKETAGEVTIGYVALDGASQLAEFHFTLLTEEAASVKVIHREAGSEEISYTETIALDNGHGETEIRNAKEATCTEDGYTGDRYCKDCGALLEQGEIIPAHCASKEFQDLDTSRWYHVYTDYVLEKGLMEGMGDGQFQPDGTLTRGMLVTTLHRLAGSPEPETATTFTDLKSGAYYEKAVAWAQEHGIVKGITTTTFGPEYAVTREQAATFLYRYVAQYLGQTPITGADLADFRDGTAVSPYSQEAMAWAVAAGLFEGYGDGTLRARTFLTRAQMAKLLTILDQNF